MWKVKLTLKDNQAVLCDDSRAELHHQLAWNTWLHRCPHKDHLQVDAHALSPIKCSQQYIGVRTAGRGMQATDMTWGAMEKVG